MDYLNPFSDNFILKSIINYLNPLSDDFILAKIISFVVNFFDNLLEFLIHIIIPTDSQLEAIKQDFSDLGSTFKNHLPFVGFFSDSLEEAKQIVYNEDFLNIKFKGWSFDLGIIHYSTDDIEFTGVLDAYEPYRMSIRTLLTLVVYILGLVYLIKYFLKYGETEGNNGVISGQTSSFDRK